MNIKNKTSTIFKQLILNIIVPVVCALVILALLNQYRVKTTTDQNNKIQNQLITDQIELSLVHQDFGLEAVESRIEADLFVQSHHLVNRYFKNTDSIEVINLSHIRDSLNMYSREQDIYIINREGTIVNTTFEKDRNFNLFTIGEKFQAYIEDVFDKKEYVSEKFSIELKTGKLRKYTYQPTLDGKYLIQTGTYSLNADKWVNKTKETLGSISNKYKNIKKIDLFIDADTPFSLITSSTTEENTDFIKDIFNTLDTNLSKTIKLKENGRYIEKEYIPMKRQNTTLYEKALIEIIADRTDIHVNQRNDILQNVAIFLFTILLVIFLIFQKTRVITSPIKKLLDNVNRITKGDLSGRADVEGNNEITKLSEKFNYMVERLQTLYDNLELKVKERTADLNAKKDELEEQKKDIEDSIRYAKRIQNAILPPMAYVESLFPNSFIYYQSKDIVSGDFYWVGEVDNTKLMAIVDCTGHGVPGAFMSIIGNNQLTQTVGIEKTKVPSDILNDVNSGVTALLRQTKGNTEVKDGMDLALISLDYDTLELNFAGAYNPVYIIRNKELIEIKANKFPIGGFLNQDLEKFDNNVFQLIKNDMIYMFSDGYMDQFGGPKGKKFKSRNMKNLMIEISELPCDEQHKILKDTITDWMKNEEQIDDILVSGIKI
ncbi:SpoIIE family protein phosphatase [Vicingaceae bacterium]|nr:SpoIIE family protein phosphatase [Vicingaceae bacterium]